MKKRLYCLMVLCIVFLVSYISVTGVTACPSEEDYLHALKVMINKYVDDPTDKNLGKILDLIVFYDTHELEKADCSVSGKYSTDPIYTGDPDDIISDLIDEELPPCFNGVKDGTETGEDCGGSCGPCILKEGECNSDADCDSNHYCDTNNKCASRCTNGEIDGLETDTDCGGSLCSACGEGKSCVADSDCESSLNCLSGTCSSSDCICIPTAGDSCDTDCANGWDPDCLLGAFQPGGYFEACDNQGNVRFGSPGGVLLKTWSFNRAEYLKKVSFRMIDVTTECWEHDKVRISFRYETIEPVCSDGTDLGWVIVKDWFEPPRSRDWVTDWCAGGPVNPEIDVYPDQDKRVKEIKLEFIEGGSDNLMGLDCIKYERVEDKDADGLDVSVDCEDTDSSLTDNCVTPCTSDCICKPVSDSCPDPDCANGWDPDYYSGSPFDATGDVGWGTPITLNDPSGVWFYDWTLSKPERVNELKIWMESTTTECNKEDMVNVLVAYSDPSQICTPDNTPDAPVTIGWPNIFPSNPASFNPPEWNGGPICGFSGSEPILDVSNYVNKDRKLHSIRILFLSDDDDGGPKHDLIVRGINFTRVEDKDADLSDASQDCDDYDSDIITCGG